MNNDSFSRPGMEFRPAPFWAINDELDPHEAARQLTEMIDHGFSGGFFHSRTGLLSRYLGPDWFAALNAAVEAAEQAGGHVWLYDEDQWPSGNAGGLIAAMNDRYRMATIEAEFVACGQAARAHGEETPLAAYRIEGRNAVAVSDLIRMEVEEAGAEQNFERMILRRRYEPKIAWWNGQSHVNLLEPEVTQEFLHRTHKVYREAIGDKFGEAVPGIFTDEPSLHATGQGFPWWEGMPEVYQEWTGREFWADAPWVFFEGRAARAARLHIHRTVLRQFVESYSRPLFEWCDRNNLVLTGHYLEESTLAWQLRATWGGIMAHYRWMHMPGLDHLCRQLDVDLPLLLAGKQVSSAARQLGRPRALLEAFACIRHSSTMEDFRWLTDANIALGANFFCPHMQVYSMRGRRKRDYPPNIGEAQTYWEDWGDLNDYIARLCYAMTSGEAAPDLLILHPVQSAMADHRLGFERTGGLCPSDLPGAETAAIDQWDALFRQVVAATINAGFDCDLGDEGLLAELGSVDGSRLRVGEMSYPVVIVPPSRTWAPATVKLLKTFAEAGGSLLFVGAHPTEIDCEPAGEPWDVLTREAAGSVPCSTPALQVALDRLLPDAVRVRTADGHTAVSTWVHKRREGDRWILFVVNTHRERAESYEISLPWKAGLSASRWDAVTGTATRIPSVQSGDRLRIPLHLNRADSALLVIETTSEAALSPTNPIAAPETVIPLVGPWKYQCSEPNVLVIDRLATSLDGGQCWSPEDMDHRIRQRVARHFGVEAALEWQPWMVRDSGAFQGKGGPVSLRYCFQVSEELPVSASLVMEWHAAMEVTINDKLVDFREAVTHWERNFRAVPITQCLHAGNNTVVVSFPYDCLSEIEPIYVTGDFGVRLDDQEPVITSRATTLSTGSWVQQGLPFYSGEITYQIPFDAPVNAGCVRLRLRNAQATLFRLRVNGEDAGKILWSPYESDLTPYVIAGANLLELTVIGSRQNTFGPLHDRQSDGEGAVASPEHYQNEAFLREQWSLHDYGIMGGIELVAVQPEV